MKEVCVYGNYVHINEDNPAFNYWLNNDLPYITVQAIITDEKRTWREKINVSSLEKANQQCNEVMKFFNNTRPNGQGLCRRFIGLYKEDDRVSGYKDNQGMTGWLSPKGKFIECEFGYHASFVQQFFKHPINTEDVISIQNQGYVKMGDVSSFGGESYIEIKTELTQTQIDWLILFIDKFTYKQRWTIKKILKEYGMGLEMTY